MGLRHGFATDTKQLRVADYAIAGIADLKLHHVYRAIA